MGPISSAVKAMIVAHQTFKDHGLLTDEECRVCCRMIDRGVHAEGCPVEGLRLATEHLKQFLATI